MVRKLLKNVGVYLLFCLGGLGVALAFVAAIVAIVMPIIFLFNP